MYVGDRVRLSKEGKSYYADEPWNPHNLEGMIADVDPYEYTSHYVKWDNGEINAYEEDHLELESESNQSDYFDYNGELISVGDIIELVHVPASVSSELEGNIEGIVKTLWDNSVYVEFQLSSRKIIKSFHPNCTKILASKGKKAIISKKKKTEEQTQVKTILISNTNFLKINQDE